MSHTKEKWLRRSKCQRKPRQGDSEGKCNTVSARDYPFLPYSVSGSGKMITENKHWIWVILSHNQTDANLWVACPSSYELTVQWLLEMS